MQMENLFCLFLLIFINAYSEEFLPTLNITTQNSRGIGFYVQNTADTYDIEPSTYDSNGNLQSSSKTPNFVIVDAIPYNICDTWNLLNRSNRIAPAAATYLVNIKMINKATGSIYIKSTKFLIKLSDEQFVEIISCSTSDNLIRSKNPFVASNINSSSKAILPLEGNDALYDVLPISRYVKFRSSSA